MFGLYFSKKLLPNYVEATRQWMNFPFVRCLKCSQERTSLTLELNKILLKTKDVSNILQIMRKRTSLLRHKGIETKKLKTKLTKIRMFITYLGSNILAVRRYLIKIKRIESLISKFRMNNLFGWNYRRSASNSDLLIFYN